MRHHDPLEAYKWSVEQTAIDGGTTPRWPEIMKIKAPTEPELAKWDSERCVTVTPGFRAALKNLLREEIKMMAAKDGPEYWTWGVARIEDLADMGGIKLEFGGDKEKPTSMTGDVQVIIL